MMRIRSILLGAFTVSCLMGVQAFAEDACDTDCPEGQTRVSYADGNHLTCVCVDPGAPMEEGPAGCEGADCDAPNESTGE